MKKICILAYWYPPLQAVGSLRAESFVKYAKQNGFEAFVVSIKPNELCTPEAPEVELSEKVYRVSGFDLNFLLRNLIKRVLGKGESKSTDQYKSSVKSNNKAAQFIKKSFYYIYRKSLCFPDTHFLWYPCSKRQLARIIEEEKPEFILTTAFPVSSFYFGRYIKKKYPQVKWIADYRDLWSQHQWYERPWPLNAIERITERKLLKSADLIITTSKEFQEKLKELHSERAQIPLVYNGYDEEVNETVYRLPKFTISYTGVLYEQQRPEIFLGAVKNLLDQNEIDKQKIQIDFYGKMPDYLCTLVEQYQLTEIVKIHGLIPRVEVIKKQRKSNLLLLIRWDAGPLHVKIFEYLSARVPILALVNDHSEIAELVNETGSGKVCQDIHSTTKAILDEYTFWLDKSSNRLVKKSTGVNFYSRANQAKELYKLLS